MAESSSVRSASTHTPPTNSFSLPSLPITNITNFISIKLDGSNYLLWKDQFEDILITTDLIGYVEGKIKEPAKFVTIDGVESINPEYVSWRKFDRFVKSCLKATLTESVAAQF
ncbi:hypothetical protein BVC80_6731g1 [Macleaya cordata]|uniref:Retrotransposon Copia-like N-terminal domain-containing protein n=1 Tax=Macleaya cordata TaxID=56857 RepID=A0A200QB06_MACCD|nr:hypothetical protein BVC80_6731g1 [Macleaya cordata]